MYKIEKTAAGLKTLSIRLSACIVAASSLIGCALAAPATVTAQGGLRLRTAASTSSQTVATLASGAQVEVLEALDGWYRIEASGKTGYVSSQYLRVTGTVSASSLNVRSTASTSGSRVTSLSSGTKVEILESLDGWYRIEAGGKTGYVSSQYISLDRTEPAAPAPTPAPAPPPKQEVSTTIGTVTASSLNIRKTPSTSGTKVGSLPSGTLVEILEALDGWYCIDADGRTGYVSSKYISLSQPEQTPVKTAPAPQPEPQPEVKAEQPAQDSKTYGMVSASSLNVRSGPGSNYNKVKSLSSGAQVEILETLEGWYRIADGYVSAEYIVILDGSMSALQAEIVAYARTFLGCAYVYGGNGPKSFDCSGLTKYVYKHFGYNINRTATQQLKNGVVVSKENLQPGDLVFFNSAGTGIDKATHVGIYIGNGEFLHASNKKVGVTITSLSDAYRVRTYTTARRII